jgi:hypothetical protein
MDRWVEIEFDCLPLRSIGRLDIPLDASPKYRQRCERLKHSIERHGQHNTYYLSNARCAFHLANSSAVGLIEFRFDGTILTDADDLYSTSADLTVELVRETCDWLTAPVVEWFHGSVTRAVMVEFDRYIDAGDLDKAKERAAEMQAKLEKSGGYVGMYL